MKPSLIIASLTFAGSICLQAAEIIDANNTVFSLSGPTFVREGNIAAFVNSATVKWTVNNGVASGSDRIGTTVTPLDSNDYYFQFAGTDLSDGTDDIPVTSARYVEIKYSHSGDWSGGESSHNFRVDTTGEPAAFLSPTGRNLIPPGTATGPQSIIIDLTEGGTDWSGNWTVLRWDMFNGQDNSGGKTFTIDSVTFANAVVGITPPDLQWDTSTDPGFQKGSANWNLTETNWSEDGTTPQAWIAVLPARFAGADTPDAIITITENLGAGSLSFENSGYTLVGDSPARTVAVGSDVSISDSKSAVIGSALTVTSTAGLQLGQNPGINSGSLDILAGGTVQVSSGDLKIEGLNTAITVGGVLQVAGGTGRLNLGTGTLTGTDVSVTIENAGEVLIPTTGSPASSQNLLQVGLAAIGADPADVKGTITVESGGVLQVGSSGERAIRLGQYGTGTLNIEGGGVVQAGIVKLGNGGDGTGILNLVGTMEANNIHLNKSASLANFDGGTIKVTGTTGSQILQTGAGATNVRDGGLTVDTNGLDSSVTEPLSHSTIGGDAAADGGLTKTGAGTLTLTAVNTYTGPTVVDAGTLLINGNQTTATGAVAVNNDATLGGIGTIGGNVTVAAAASVAPGASAGSLFLDQDFDISAMAAGTGTLDFELDALAGASDYIDVLGTVTIGAGVLGIDDFTFTNLGALEAGTYTLISAGSPITGPLDTAVSGTIAPGFEGELQIDDFSIVLVVTAGASAYDTWAGTNGVTGGKTDDDDLDGLTNLAEFGFGTDPLNAGPSPATTTINGTGDIEISAGKGAEAGSDPATTYSVEASFDLTPGSWTTTGVSITTNDAGSIVASYTGPPAAPAGKVFLRIVVSN